MKLPASRVAHGGRIGTRGRIASENTTHSRKKNPVFIHSTINPASGTVFGAGARLALQKLVPLAAIVCSQCRAVQDVSHAHLPIAPHKGGNPAAHLYYVALPCQVIS